MPPDFWSELLQGATWHASRSTTSYAIPHDLIDREFSRSVEIFGVESHALFVDALNLADGSLAWRFNSDLRFARHGR